MRCIESSSGCVTRKSIAGSSLGPRRDFSLRAWAVSESLLALVAEPLAAPVSVLLFPFPVCLLLFLDRLLLVEFMMDNCI